MNALVFDSSTSTLIIGLLSDTDNYVACAGSKHNAVILPYIDELLTAHSLFFEDIDALAVVTGPGSFTGVRLGVTVAQGLAAVRHIPLYEINALDITALSHTDEHFVVGIDARNDNLYYGEYAKSFSNRVYSGACDGKLFRCYNGAKYKSDELSESEYANNLLKLARYELSKSSAQEKLIPYYIKQSQAEREREERHSNCIIRRMQVDDLSSVHSIEKASFPPYLVESEQSISAEIYSPTAHCFVIENSNDVVGFVICLTIVDELHIMDIAVVDTMRGKGYGEKLMQHSIELAKRMNMRGVTLEVNEHNTIAISLYEKLGFVAAGKRPKYYDMTDDAIIYWLTLA